jgi:hypothetical protein
MTDADNDILDAAIDPQAEALAEAVTTIGAAIENLVDDPGAVLTEAARPAWDAIYDADPAEFERLRKRAKAGGARVTEIDKLVGARNKRVREKTPNNNLSYTSNTGNGLLENNPTSAVYEVYQSADAMLYPSYLTWSRRTGREPLAQRRFRHVAADMARTLGADVVEVRRSEGMGIQGLKLLADNEEPYDWKLGGSGAEVAPSYTTNTSDVAINAFKPMNMQEVYEVLDIHPNFDFARTKKENSINEEVF